MKTAHDAVGLVTVADSSTLKADGMDLVYISAEPRDKDGVTVPNDDREVTFSVKGPAVIAGVASDNMLSGEEWRKDRHTTHNGRVQLILPSTFESGVVKVTASALGVKKGSVTIEAAG